MFTSVHQCVYPSTPRLSQNTNIPRPVCVRTHTHTYTHAQVVLQLLSFLSPQIPVQPRPTPRLRPPPVSPARTAASAALCPAQRTGATAFRQRASWVSVPGDRAGGGRQSRPETQQGPSLPSRVCSLCCSHGSLFPALEDRSWWQGGSEFKI